jgi:hypothetical protein
VVIESSSGKFFKEMFIIAAKYQQSGTAILYFKLSNNPLQLLTFRVAMFCLVLCVSHSLWNVFVSPYRLPDHIYIMREKTLGKNHF